MTATTLWEECTELYNKARTPKEPESNREQFNGEMVAQQRNKDGKLIGFIAFVPMTDKIACLTCCYVLPEYQGKGIATNLITQLRNKYPVIVADTYSPVAEELYKRLGVYTRRLAHN